MSTERIDIVVTKTGDQEAAKGIQGIGDASQKTQGQVDALNGAIGFLKAALVTISVGELVNQYTKLSDTFSGIVSRLKLVSTNAAQLVAVEQQLLNAANSTRGSFEASANLYTKLAQQTGQLGIDQKALIPAITTINQLIAISGTSAEEAKAGLLQFSQGLASNRLQGDELRSVLENIPALGQAIAKGLNTTSAGLRQMGAAGQLTAKTVLDAIAKTAPEIAKQFAAVAPTISGAFQVLKNNVLQLVGTFDQVNKGGTTVANAILFVANNLNTFVRALEVAIATTAAFYIGLAVQSGWQAFSAGVFAANARLQAYVLAADAAGVQTTILSRAMVAFQTPIAAVRNAFLALWAVIEANPIVAIITLLAAAGAALYIFGNDFKVTSDGSITALGAVVGVLKTLWDLIKQLGSYVATVFTPIWNVLSSVISTAFNVALQGVKALLDFLGQFIPSLNGASGALGSFGQTIIKNMQDATKSLQDTTLASANFGAGFKTTADTVSAGATQIGKSVQFVNDSLVQMGRVNAEAIPPFQNLVLAQERADEAAKRAAESMREYSKDVKAAADAADYLATHVRNAMGEMVDATDEWARRSGAYFNSVKGAATSLADTVSSSADSYQSSISQISQSSSSVGGGGGGGGGGGTTGSRNFSVYNQPDQQQLETFFKAAGGTDTGLLYAINSLGQEIAAGNSFAAANDIVDVWKRASGQTDSVKNVIKAQFPFLTAAFQGAGLAFRNGGSFMVGGQGGSDSQLVQFLASPDEQVDVTTPQQRRAAANAGGGKTVIVNMNVSTPDANSFRRSRNQNLLALQSQLARV